MNLPQRQLVRIADRIRDQLLTLRQVKQRQVRNKASGLIDQMNRLVATNRKLNLCEIRNWRAAGEKVLKQVAAAMRDIPFNVQQVEQAMQPCSIKTPLIAEIYHALKQADEEFDGLAYHKECDTLAVTTEPIELNNVYLGEFEIQLHLPSLSEMQYNSIYRLIALDPHPASSNASVTHPHVSDEHLCPGDAGAAINMALAAGRICDFFLLVRSVLTNYNPDSPYVSLNIWHGAACYDCGYVMDDENEYFCSFCENVFCGECSNHCRRCHEGACNGCLTECPACQELTCQECMSVCPECGDSLCKNCLDDMACPCIEENEEIQNEENQDSTTAGARSNSNEERNGSINVVRQTARTAETSVGVDAA